MSGSESIGKLIEPTIQALGYEFVGCQLLPEGKGLLLRVYIDRPEGVVTIDDCTKVSRQVSMLLDVEDPIARDYVLEVSSPGLERPLFNLEQACRFVGHKAIVRLRLPSEGRRTFRGLILKAKDGQLQMDVDGIVVTLPWDNVEKANLLAQFP